MYFVVVSLLMALEISKVFGADASGDAQLEAIKGNVVVLADCGSSSTKVFVYKSAGQVPQLVLKDKIEHDVAVTDERNLVLDEMKKYWLEIILRIKAGFIAGGKKFEEGKFHLFVESTAGFRRLSFPDRTTIVINLLKVLGDQKMFVFHSHHFQILTGMEEGANAWLAANLLQGTWADWGVTDDKGGRKKRKNPIGIVEVGGSSVQIAFLANPEYTMRSVYPVVVETTPGQFTRYRVYTQTFLGIGSDDAISWTFRHLAHSLYPDLFPLISNPFKGSSVHAQGPNPDAKRHSPKRDEHVQVINPCVPGILVRKALASSKYYYVSPVNPDFMISFTSKLNAEACDELLQKMISKLNHPLSPCEYLLKRTDLYAQQDAMLTTASAVCRFGSFCSMPINCEENMWQDTMFMRLGRPLSAVEEKEFLPLPELDSECATACINQGQITQETIGRAYTCWNCRLKIALLRGFGFDMDKPDNIFVKSNSKASWTLGSAYRHLMTLRRSAQECGR